MAMDEQTKQALSRNGVIDITTTGRRSGRPRRIEIMFHNIDGRLFISGMPSTRRRSWLANLDADPRFTFHLKRGLRRDLPARARIVSDASERREILTHVARTWDRRDLDKMVQYSPLIEVTIEDAAA
jgi:deazaflavin-dependent oxidoreductase (nitroreductase family)